VTVLTSCTTNDDDVSLNATQSTNSNNHPTIHPTNQTIKACLLLSRVVKAKKDESKIPK